MLEFSIMLDMSVSMLLFICFVLLLLLCCFGDGGGGVDTCQTIFWCHAGNETM